MTTPMPGIQLPFGVNLGLDSGLILVIFVGLGLLAAGLYFFFIFGKMHPKQKFMLHAKNGVFFKSLRLFNNKIVSEMGIVEMILGRVPAGFHIRRFTYEPIELPWLFIWKHVEKVYIATYVEGRLFPLPINLGSTSFTCYRCNTCGFSSLTIRNYISHNKKVLCPTNYPQELQAIEYVTPSDNPNRVDIHVEDIGSENMAAKPEWQMAIVEGRKSGCIGIMQEEQVVLDNVFLHSLKFSPELEKRYIYFVKDEATRVPMKDWIAMDDVGKEVVADYVQAARETEQIISQHNPIMTVLIASLPMAFILVSFGFAAYTMVIAQQQGNTEAAKIFVEGMQIAAEVSKQLALIKGVNVTIGG